MALSLKEIQAKLLAQQDKKDRAKNGAFGGDSSIYPFWNNPDGSTVSIRFLPDGNEANDFFWEERSIIKLSFSGIKGQPDSKPTTVQVPCMDMWKSGSCPILAETKAWWNDPSLVDLARKYWKKKSYLFQGFVVGNNPNTQDTPPENPIRRYIINPSVFDSIKSILMRQDLEYTPTDYKYGREFYLTKTQKAGFANYQSSSWSMKERALSDSEKAAIETYGLFNLGSFLPKKPDDTMRNVIIEMFHASVNEELYDPERWGEYYKPYGSASDEATANENSVSSTTSSTTASSILNSIKTKVPNSDVVTTVVDSTENNVPWDTSDSKPAAQTTRPEGKPKMSTPEDILAAIRRKTGNK